MGRYLLGRLAYAVLVLLGVHLATFLLFFAVNTPEDMARLQLGGKRVSAEQVALWQRERGYDKPLFWNGAAEGPARFTDTVYARHALPLLALRFGRADSESAGDIGHEVARRMAVSVQLAAPLFVLQLLLGVGGALWLVARREQPAARWAGAATLLLLSVSSLFVIVIGQHLIARVLKLAPVSGYAEGWAAWRFLLLPLGLALLARLPAELRLYRALLLEEAGKPHVRAALARGLKPGAVLRRHVLRNAGLPILTAAAAGLPAVFMGSLVFESFFGLPGLGAYAIEAIAAQDFAVVRSLVFLGALLYLAATLLVDVAYAWIDPRVKLGGDVAAGSSGEGA